VPLKDKNSIFNTKSKGKKPLKGLESANTPDINKFSDPELKKSKDVNSMPETPKKQGTNVNPLSDLPKKQGTDINSLPDTPKKRGADVNPSSDTPTKQGTDVNSSSDTPTKQGTDVNLFDNESKLGAEGTDVNLFDNTNKLESQGTDVNLFDNTNKLESQGKDVNLFDNESKLINLGKEAKPLSLFNLEDVTIHSPNGLSNIIDNPLTDIGNLENLSKFSPNQLDNADIENINSPIQNRHGNYPNDHNEGDFEEHSLLDNLPSPSGFTQTQNYSDKMGQLPFGNLVDMQSDLIGNSQSPLVPGHWSEIGNAGDNRDPIQEVDFFDGKTNSYLAQLSTPIPGFKQDLPVLNSTLIGAGFNPNASNSNLGDIFEIRISPTSLEQYEDRFFDDRTSHGDDSINNVNIYGGSGYDNLLLPQWHPFFGDVGTNNPTFDDPNYSNIPANAEMFNFTDPATLVNYMEGYQFDPRIERINVLPEGQTKVEFPNPVNPYMGTKFDDTLTADISEGGGLFNDLNNQYSNVFRHINTPSLGSLITLGNIHTQAGHLEAITSKGYYEESGGSFDWTGSFASADGYFDPSSGSFTLSNSSWFVGGSHVGPITNAYIDPTYQWAGAPTAGSSGSYVRTIQVNGSALTGQMLGQGDLTFDTLFGLQSKDENESTLSYNYGLYDDRLNIRYGSGGYRGHEPYMTTAIPDNDSDGRTSSHLFRVSGKAFDDSNRVGGRFEKDKDRIQKWLASSQGQDWQDKQADLANRNARNAKNWNVDAMTDFTAGHRRGLRGHAWQIDLSNVLGVDLGKFQYDYQWTLYENTLGLFNIDIPDETWGGNGITTLLSINNLLYKANVSPVFVGGNAFQVRGLLNPYGYTDTSNVTPTSLGDMISDNLWQLALSYLPLYKHQTLAGGRHKDSNPRALELAADPISKQYTTTKGTDRQGKSGGSLRPWVGGWDANRALVKGEEKTQFYFQNYKESDAKFLNITTGSLKNYQGIPKDVGALGGAGQLADIGQTVGKLTGTGDPDQDTMKIYQNRTDTSTSHYMGLGMGPWDLTVPKTDEGAGDGTPHGSAPFKHVKSPGDFMTLRPISSVKDKRIEGKMFGYPLYFKDLRDNTYIIFRGLIEGLTEQISPSWSEDSYLGKPESSYVYTKTSREITFTLKLVAQSRAELDMIYDKIDKLSSLAYPQFKLDTVNWGSTNKMRMKPPLCEFRMGELFGNKDENLFGFIRSMSWSFPDTAPWEHEEGSRVPKMVTCAITYQVINRKLTNMLTKFHGKQYSHSRNNLVTNIHNVGLADYENVDRWNVFKEQVDATWGLEQPVSGGDEDFQDPIEPEQDSAVA